MTIKAKRITTAIATGAILLNAISPVAFATEITVSGNGSSSDNVVKVSTSNSNVVKQNNNADVKNNVSSNASTGGNSSSLNTGGDVKIKTGDATSKTSVDNNLNTNKANVNNCGSCNGAADVTISKNGDGSENTVKINNANENFVYQDNNANVYNKVNADAKTGKNDADFNTNGDVKIVTGDATTKVSVGTTANKNVANIGGGNGAGNGSSVTIYNNGAFSDNSVKLNDYSAVVIDQDNKAKVNNDVDAKSDTGKNDADYNTGGDVKVKTGDAETKVKVNNKVNFNAADVDCECLLNDLDVNVEKNGAKSDNKVKASDNSDLFVYEDNDAKLKNNVDGDAQSGKNDSDFNTGDPKVKTGNATSKTDVENDGNVNLYNQGASLHLPGDWDVEAGFDLEALLAFFHLQV